MKAIKCDLPYAEQIEVHTLADLHISVALVEKLFVNGASALNYGGYGDAQNFKPNSKSNPVVYLCGTRREMFAKL